MEILDINRDEILRYLGYRGNSPDNATEQMLKECIKETLQIAQPRYSYRTFSISIENSNISVENSNISVENAGIFTRSKDLSRLLQHSDYVTMVIVTLGHEIDKKIKFYGYNQLERALVIDACAATLIEEVADIVQENVSQAAKQKHYQITTRFSPGYGDLPLDVQPKIINILDATKKIGIDTTKSSMLIPSKSITAFIGWTKPDLSKNFSNTKHQPFHTNAPKGCKSCIQYINCYYLKGGTYCDFRKKTLESREIFNT